MEGRCGWEVVRRPLLMILSVGNRRLGQQPIVILARWGSQRHRDLPTLDVLKLALRKHLLNLLSPLKPVRIPSVLGIEWLFHVCLDESAKDREGVDRFILIRQT